MNFKFAIFQKVEGPCVQVVNPNRRPVFLEVENKHEVKQESKPRKRGRPRKTRETKEHG